MSEHYNSHSPGAPSESSSEAVRESWRIQMQLQEQAIRERSGQGMTLVTPSPTPLERARPVKRQRLELDGEG